MAAKKNKFDFWTFPNQWSDWEFLIDNFRKINRKNKNLRIYIDYKYGPLTTQRRNEALKMRRQMINNDEIVQGYISYPAKLIAKRNVNSEWELIKDYSKEIIPVTSLDFSINRPEVVPDTPICHRNFPSRFKMMGFLIPMKILHHCVIKGLVE